MPINMAIKSGHNGYKKIVLLDTLNIWNDVKVYEPGIKQT